LRAYIAFRAQIPRDAAVRHLDHDRDVAQLVIAIIRPTDRDDDIGLGQIVRGEREGRLTERLKVCTKLPKRQSQAKCQLVLDATMPTEFAVHDLDDPLDQFGLVVRVEHARALEQLEVLDAELQAVRLRQGQLHVHERKHSICASPAKASNAGAS
jgi:hypothetical protein